jgi:hypothetical protein
MLLSRFATIIALSFIGLALTQTPSEALAEPTDRMAAQDTPPANCQVTLPSDGSFVPPSPVPAGPATHFGIAADGTVSKYGTEKLWTLLPTDGIWRGLIPSKPGDFAYDNKLPWFRIPFSGRDGSLTVTGRRLDGPAPSFTETYESSAFPDGAMIMGGISIPVFGCWEITGHFKDQKLSFTVWVTPLPERKSSSAESSAAVSQKPSPPEIAPRRIHVDSEVQERSLVYSVTPEIPHEAQVANVSGTVVLHAVINRDGRARELQYVSGPPLLAQAAIDAARWRQYWVAFVNDKTDDPVEVDTTIDIVFPHPHN